MNETLMLALTALFSALMYVIAMYHLRKTDHCLKKSLETNIELEKMTDTLAHICSSTNSELDTYKEELKCVLRGGRVSNMGVRLWLSEEGVEHGALRTSGYETRAGMHYQAGGPTETPST